MKKMFVLMVLALVACTPATQTPAEPANLEANAAAAANLWTATVSGLERYDGFYGGDIGQAKVDGDRVLELTLSNSGSLGIARYSNNPTYDGLRFLVRPSPLEGYIGIAVFGSPNERSENYSGVSTSDSLTVSGDRVTGLLTLELKDDAGRVLVTSLNVDVPVLR